MSRSLRVIRALTAACLLTAAAISPAGSEPVSDAVLAPVTSAFMRAVKPGEQADLHRELFETVLRRVHRSYAREVDVPQLTKPALVNIFEGGKTPPLPARELEAMGYRIGIYPSQTHRAAIAAAKRVLAVLKRDGDTAAIEGELATFNDREEAVNSRRWRELETKYLKDV